MSLALTTTLILGLAAGDPGFVRPDPDSLTRVFGSRFKVDLSRFELLKINAEEWSIPYISDDNVRAFVGTRTGRLEAFELATGDSLWHRKDMGSIGGSMIEYDGLLLIGSDSSLVAVDQQIGQERWRVDIAGRIGGRMVRSGNLAVIPVRPNGYVCVNLEEHKQQWRVKRPTPDGITVRGQAAPYIDKDRNTAYLGFSDGTLQAVTLDKGAKKWSAALGKSREFFADVDTQPIPVQGGRKLLAASYNGGLFQLDVEGGKVDWKTELKSITSMTLTGPGLLAASLGDGQVVGIYRGNGKVRWRYKIRKGFATDPLYVGRGLVVVGTSEGPLTVLDANSGQPRQLFTPGSGLSVSPFYRDPDLVMLTNKGLVMALRYGVGIGITP